MNWPKTEHELTAEGYQLLDWNICRACGEDILWSITPHGKRMPLERAGDDDDHYQSHFASCFAAQDFRKRS